MLCSDVLDGSGTLATLTALACDASSAPVCWGCCVDADQSEKGDGTVHNFPVGWILARMLSIVFDSRSILNECFSDHGAAGGGRMHVKPREWVHRR